MPGGVSGTRDDAKGAADAVDLRRSAQQFRSGDGVLVKVGVADGAVGCSGEDEDVGPGGEFEVVGGGPRRDRPRWTEELAHSAEHLALLG